jgi:hypothetical protein
MTIALLCPNGHKLLCPESQAGKRGKCPHCGAIFRVPEVSGSGKLDSSISSNGNDDSGPTGTPVPLVTASAAGPGSAPVISLAPHKSGQVETVNPIRHYDDGEELGENEIGFLCPNGHHLCGDTELGGQPGECPECGAKFLVPTAEELSPAEEDEPPAKSSLFNFDVDADDEPEGSSRSEFFERLWGYKARGATIELYLEGGTMLIPDGFATDLSKRDEGVFVVKESDGTFTIAVVAWQSITHMAVRGLEQLPEGVFDMP